MRQHSDAPVRLDRDFVTLAIAGKPYHLCCTWKALRIASVLLKAMGIPVNLMAAVDFRDLRAEMVVPLFYAMAVQQHPGLSYEDIVARITLTTWDEAATAVAEAYQQAMPAPERNAVGSEQDGTEMSEAEAWLHWTVVAQIDLGLSLRRFEEMTPDISTSCGSAGETCSGIMISCSRRFVQVFKTSA